MKKLMTIFTVLSVLFLLFSCGKKEVEPGSANKEFELVFTDIFVAGGASASTAPQSLRLQTLLPNDYKNVKTSNLQYSDSYLEVKGLPEGISLRDLKINANGKEYVIGNVPTDTKFSTNDVLNHLSSIASELANNKTMNVYLAFSNSGANPIAGGVTITLHFNTLFRW